MIAKERPLKVLIGCESSGTVRGYFRALGHDAYSCDLLPADDSDPYHLQCDVFDAIASRKWDIGIFHPECTYLCSSGLHWNRRRPGRAEKTEAALDFVQRLMNCGIPRWAIENPMGCISTRIRKPDQVIQPYEFGDDASKRTCLWLHNLDPLEKKPELRVPGRVVGVDGRGRPIERWANQTDSGQNRLAPSEDRWKLRSKTYNGIARAMATHWSYY